MSEVCPGIATRPISRLVLAISAVLWSLPGGEASATTFFEEEEVTCPIGGETFSMRPMASTSYWGQRPDGMRYGPNPVPSIPECPENGLLLFKDFSDRELRLLAEAVASEEWERLRAEETQRYRQYWLLRVIDAPPLDVAAALLQATWLPDNRGGMRPRYMKEFVNFMATFPLDDESFWLHLRAANALRDLGRFEEAAAIVEQLASAPARPPRAGAQQLEFVDEFLVELRKLIVERNAAIEPANLTVGDNAIARRCASADPPLTTSELPVCAREEISEHVLALEENCVRISVGGTPQRCRKDD